MTDPDDLAPPLTGLADLPVGATGSGVADLEIAYEQMRIAQEADTPTDTPVLDRDAGLESAAHPS